jgi:hemolysin III
MESIEYQRMRTSAGEQRQHTDRALSLGEEIANAISHGLGLLLILAAAPFFINSALRHSNQLKVFAVSVFVASAAFLYLTSTIYHALPRGKAKRVFRVLDHCAIFLLIAGSSTPFTLGVLRAGWGWVLFVVMWTLAALGVIFKTVFGMRYPALSTSLYVGMGWLLVVAFRPLSLAIPFAGLMLLLAGGLAYTGGVAFYSAGRIRYSHFVWHLFVITGTVCHGLAILWYAG